MTIEILHNPRCSKSRETLALLESKTDDITIIKYLEDAPTQKRLKEIARLLGVTPKEMMRQKEAEFKAQNLGDAPEADLFRAMANMPKLIERPIVIKGNNQAVIGRPPENVLALF